MSRERDALARQREAQRASAPKRPHLVAFLMASFSDDFETARNAVRIVVEDKLGCELRIATDKTSRTSFTAM